VYGKFYACPLFFGEKGFDCRLIIDGERLELGVYHEVPIKFLFIEYAYPEIRIGRKFHLWAGRKIAEGEIVRIVNSDFSG